MKRLPIGVFAAAALVLATPATSATPPRDSESFPIGTEGALCEAQGVMLGSARATLFDRKWALICADVDRPTPEGVTPLMNAIDNNQYAIANLLLDRGANPHLMDWWGRTALYLTADMRTRGGAGRPGPGAPGAQGNQEGDGPFGVAFADAPPPPPVNSALQVMRRLLEMGVDPNTQLNMHRPFRGRFTDDLRPERLVHACIVRSPHAHARVRGIDTKAAAAVEGVHAVLTFADLPEPLRPTIATRCPCAISRLTSRSASCSDV